MRIAVFIFFVGLCAGQNFTNATVQSFAKFDGPWHSEGQGRVSWCLGEMLYVTSDGIWLRLNGTISQYVSEGSVLHFNYREGHSQDVGTWSIEKGKTTIRARGRRLGMGNPSIVTELLNERWRKRRTLDSKDVIEVVGTKQKALFLELTGQSPDRRVLAAIDEERHLKGSQRRSGK